MRRCFFFSSRRRHTRLVSDWSSDVCSSDLRGLYRRDDRQAGAKYARHVGEILERSEERRVGKECRFWWVPDHEKKKSYLDEFRRLHRNQTTTLALYDRVLQVAQEQECNTDC